MAFTGDDSMKTIDDKVTLYEEFETKVTADVPMKFDTEKNRVELLPVEALEEIGLALTFGAEKYEPWNWKKGFAWSRLIGSTLRHLFAWMRGEDKDPESGLSHLAHAGCCILFLITHEKLGLGEDDRR